MTRIEVPNSSFGRGSSGRGGSGRGKRIVLLAVLLLVAGVALWTWLTLSWSYSEGERGGVLQRFSRSGWLCKTQEGELALYIVSGISPQLWHFSVRDPGTAAALTQAVGQRVQVHYTEHPGVPTSCFGETPFYVDRVTVVGAPAAAQ
jgi:hypothetical protein